MDKLSGEMLRLQEEGANNINLVTAGSYMKSVAKAIEKAKSEGLRIPILYNTSAYESVDEIKRLEGIVDIYLPDMKYMSKELAGKYSNAPDYPETALAAIDEMVRQTFKGGSAFSFTDEDTKTKVYNVDEYEELSDDISMVITRGTIVRHLLLPGCEADSKAVIKEMIRRYDDKIFLSVMNQYTPMEQVKEHFPELYRKYDAALYDEMLDYAIDLGLSHGFFQDGDVAEESFIPDFGPGGRSM